MSEKSKHEYVRLSDFPENDENPFLANLLIPKGKRNVIISKDESRILVNSATGEEEETLHLAVKKELDKEQFVKLFHSQLQALFDLSKAALKVFAYFASETTFNDRIIFDLDKCKEFTKYSATDTIYRAIGELLKAEIIARTKASNIYYINPSVFYRGDRIVMVTEYRKKKISSIQHGPELPFPNSGNLAS